MSAGSVSSAEVAQLFFDVVPLAMRAYRDEMRKSRGDFLTVPQFRILAQLFRTGHANNKDLAELQGVSVAAMSRMVDGLVERGLVERHANITDRRQITLKLTKEGTTKFKSIRRNALENFKLKFSGCDKRELRMMTEGLQALQDGIAIRIGHKRGGRA